VASKIQFQPEAFPVPTVTVIAPEFEQTTTLFLWVSFSVIVVPDSVTGGKSPEIFTTAPDSDLTQSSEDELLSSAHICMPSAILVDGAVPLANATTLAALVPKELVKSPKFPVVEVNSAVPASFTENLDVPAESPV
jgi:hypothetical protein